MLTRIRLENFRSWKDTKDLSLRPITGFFGANSSEKSGLIHSILLLKQTAESADRGNVFNFGGKTAQVEMGDFASVLHRHEKDCQLGISLGWRTEREVKITDTFKSRDVTRSKDVGFDVKARLEASRSSSNVVVKEMSYRVGDAQFGMRPDSRNRFKPFAKSVDFEFVRSRGRPWDINSLVKCYGFPDTLRANYQNAGFLSDLEFALEQRLQDVYYLGPLRAFPQRTYTWSGGEPADMGQAGELVVDALLAARQRGRKISPGYRRRRLTSEQYVARWLKELGLIHDFRVVRVAEGSNLFEVRVRKSPRAAEVLIPDVGFGVSQILPALVLCFYVPEGSTVVLEQPEIHLHPSVQSGLADVFIDAWRKRGVQILVESHSEHLLRRLQRRIAEEALCHDELGLYFCSVEDGVSKVDQLEVDLYGNIANWPQDFFGDQFGEIASMSEAALKRRPTAV